jgi:hypothetical protein
MGEVVRVLKTPITGQTVPLLRYYNASSQNALLSIDEPIPG